MTGQAHAAGGIRTTVAATPGRERRGAARERRAARRRGPSPGHHHARDQERLRPRCRDRGRASSSALADRSPPRPPFLGAHVVPEGIGRDEYVALVAGPMLDACAPHARWADVFIERGAFDVDEARHHPRSRCREGPRPSRAHRPARPLRRRPASPSSSAPRAPTTAPFLTDEDVAALAGSEHGRDPAARRRVLHPAAVPGCPRLLDAGVTVAIATDCNPGSSLHDIHAVLHRAGRAGTADEPGRGPARGHAGRRRGPAPRRRRAPSHRRAAGRPRRSSTHPATSILAYRPGAA